MQEPNDSTSRNQASPPVQLELEPLPDDDKDRLTKPFLESTAEQGAESDPENNLMVLPPSARGNERIEPFRFTGKADEYFRIWVVNLFLTLITLGLWSPWAKIRKRRYFLRNTWVAGANFEYHAKPWPILRGRLLAGLAFVIYWFAGELNPRHAAWIALAIALIAPWIVVSSLRFNLSNTSYRNLRFAFEGNIRDGIGALWPIWLAAASAAVYPIEFGRPGSIAGAALSSLAYVLFVLFYPYMHGKLRLLLLDRSRYGAAPIACTTRVKTFYTIYGRGALVGIGAFIAAFVLVMMLLGAAMSGMRSAVTPDWPWLPVLIGLVTMAPIAIAGMLWYAFTQSRLINATFNLTTISTNVRVFSRLQTWPLAKLYIVNTLAVLFTLGLAIPWAAVRTARLRVETTALALSEDLDDIIADAVPATSATADATSEFFSLDIAL